MNEANECTCPSGDGSLVHPCPAHPAVEQAGGDERVVDGKPRATKCPDCGEGDLMPGDLCACGYETDPAAGYACSECDGSGEGCVGEVCRECDGSGWFVTPEQARAALAQPSPAQGDEKPGDSILCYGCFAKGVGPDHFDEAGKCLAAQGEQAEPKSGLEGWRDAIRQLAEQEEAVGCQGTNCGTTTGDHSPECLAEAAASQGWELKPEDLGEVEVVGYLATAEHPKHGQPHKAFNYFKDQHDAQVAHWRERGCTVTEDRLMTVSQHERIVGELRAVIAQLRQHKNDYMDSGQETYRALQ
ncbi:TPA: hypothetical protein NIH38_006449, partial [Pseudomonas aeruginosa]|nr:hypothetical protein [Pseudomonas aeruginosa]